MAARIIVDPLGDPSFDEAISGATRILVSLGRADHSADALEISTAIGAAVVGVFDRASWVAPNDRIETTGSHKGGTVSCVAVIIAAALPPAS
ncbi:MAG: hypothetical protein AAF360_13160 [Pseudomonadota bacterium]